MIGTIKDVRDIISENYEEVFDTLNINEKNGLSILELLITQYEPKKPQDLVKKIKLLKLNDDDKTTYTMLVLLLNKLIDVVSHIPQEAVNSFLDDKNRSNLPFRNVIYDLSLMIKLLNSELTEKSPEHVGIFITLLNIMSLSKLVKPHHLVEFMSLICRDNGYTLADVLEGFFECYFFFSKMLNFDESCNCKDCDSCSDETHENYH